MGYTNGDKRSKSTCTSRQLRVARASPHDGLLVSRSEQREILTNLQAGYSQLVESSETLQYSSGMKLRCMNDHRTTY